jgi:hypothetical protein
MNTLRAEEGQAMVLAAGLLMIMLVALAVVLDVGWWLRDKRDAQNDVDATVLAGAQELPDEAAASAMAEAWGARNGAPSGDLICCEFEDLSGDGSADLIRARVEREPGSLTGRLLDVGIVTVTARAAAAKQRAISGCVMPWAVIGDTSLPPPEESWGLDAQELYAFHMSDFLTPGNFGALALYGNGAVDYVEAIMTPCGDGSNVCDQDDPYVDVGETLDCDVKTGNMGQNTHAALTERDGLYGPPYPESTCDVDVTLADAYDTAVTKAQGVCGESRVVLIPIIIQFPDGGHGPIDILGVASFYIAGWDRQGPYGDQDVDGDTHEDMVWGYFLIDQDIMEAWQIQWGYSDDPFAPTRVLLVE